MNGKCRKPYYSKLHLSQHQSDHVEQPKPFWPWCPPLHGLAIYHSLTQALSSVLYVLTQYCQTCNLPLKGDTHLHLCLSLSPKLISCIKGHGVRSLEAKGANLMSQYSLTLFCGKFPMLGEKGKNKFWWGLHQLILLSAKHLGNFQGPQQGGTCRYRPFCRRLTGICLQGLGPTLR